VDETVHLGQLNQLLGSVVSDQRQIHSFGNLREHREVRPGTVERGTERVRTTRPFLHLTTVATSDVGDLIGASFGPECSFAPRDAVEDAAGLDGSTAWGLWTVLLGVGLYLQRSLSHVE
jgi:hypothetical protein